MNEQNASERTYKELLMALPPHEWIDALAEAFEIAELFDVSPEFADDTALFIKSGIHVATIGWDTVIDGQLPVR